MVFPVTGPGKFQAGLAEQPDCLIQAVAALIVCFLISAVKPVFFPDKKRQRIFIDMFFFIIVIIPDKAAFVPVLAECLLPELRGIYNPCSGQK